MLLCQLVARFTIFFFAYNFPIYRLFLFNRLTYYYYSTSTSTLTLWILNLRFCEAKGLVSNKVITSIVETTTVLCLLLFLVTRKQRSDLFNLPSCSLLLFKSLLKASDNYKLVPTTASVDGIKVRIVGAHKTKLLIDALETLKRQTI